MIRQIATHARAFSLASAAVLGLASQAQAGWQLTFGDEFNGGSLDQSKWRLSDKWGNQTLAGNGEKQCYLPDAVAQADGKLVITARKQTTPAAQCKGAKEDMTYASGEITTSGCNQWESGPQCRRLKSFGQAYGYFEMRAKFAKGKGYWPAFWLMPTDGSWPPEIDVVEALGHEPSKVYNTYHFNNAGGAHQQDGQAFDGQDFTASFNTYGLDWKPGLMVWYVNGKEVFRHAGADVTSKPMYLLLNLAIGGNWPGNPDASTTFPGTMEVDYVRVYRRVEDGKPDDKPPTAENAASIK
ncbi:MAG: glycoside hydrolase family 16 protein [Hyphomicrobiales bacterium]|nr:glycoside hydrolase family 16 protein [Hyphomicrobiales bacterium]